MTQSYFWQSRTSQLVTPQWVADWLLILKYETNHWSSWSCPRDLKTLSLLNLWSCKHENMIASVLRFLPRSHLPHYRSNCPKSIALKIESIECWFNPRNLDLFELKAGVADRCRPEIRSVSKRWKCNPRETLWAIYWKWVTAKTQSQLIYVPAEQDSNITRTTWSIGYS